MKKIITKTAALFIAGTIAIGGNSLSAQERDIETVVTEQIVTAAGKTSTTSAISAGELTARSVLENIEVWYDSNRLMFDVQPQQLDGILMLPLRNTLEVLGYNVTWNGEARSIDIQKGVQFTAVYVGQNRYFFNKVAPAALSSAPAIVDGRTMVPVEFFIEIMKLGIEFDGKVVQLIDEEYASSTGYIQKIEENEEAYILTITDEPMEAGSFSEAEDGYSFLKVSKTTSIINTEGFTVGDQVTFTHLPYMILIYPAQYTAITVR